MTVSPLLPKSRSGMERYDTHIPNRWVSENRFMDLPSESENLPSFSRAREILPIPFWQDHGSTIDCYWRAWELAFSNLKQPSLENDFAGNYCDTAFNGNLFMWDSSFITFFGIYARRIFNFQQTLDNFYRKQHKDGFICREISEADGQDCFPRYDPSSTGPNLMAWSEWNYFKNSGDLERLIKVFPPLMAYHQWLREYRTWPDGSYWSTGWGSGMDNLPRVKGSTYPEWDHGHMTWVDTTFQVILSAKVLSEMASTLGRETEAGDLKEEIEKLQNYANKYLWNPQLDFYCDRLANGDLSTVKILGAYWALLAGSVPMERLSSFVAHLENTSEFNRIHRIPALSADDPGYSGTGGYWSGGIWAPTNYMTIKGLATNGLGELAHEIAKNHLENIVKVFESDDIHWDGADQFRQYFQLDHLTFDDKHTLWENYAPDMVRPGSHSKPGYVGWTGLPPIAVLFENVFGITQDAVANKLFWHVRLTEDHGISRYPFGSSGLVDLKCDFRASRLDKPIIEVHSNISFIMEVIWEGGMETLKIEKES